MAVDNEQFETTAEQYVYNSSDLLEENKLLKRIVDDLKDEVSRFKKTPFIICTVKSVYEKEAVIQIPNGNEYYVENLSNEEINAGDSVLVEQKNLTIIRKKEKSKRFAVESFLTIEKPKTSWADIGGLKKQEQEIHEIVELPMLKPEMFKKIGIDPPKGILLYGPPGTGKTLLAKAVAAKTNSTFIQIVASELVQKFIGEGAKLVKEIFQLAREKAPSIIFIDEIDALAGKRTDYGTSGEMEVQRTFMQLLAELDGFKPLGNVKIIGATNREDMLDSAIIRPGRLDRLILCDIPDKSAREDIFKIHTKKMNLDKKMPTKEFIKLMDGFSGAEIKAVCTESGYFALREDRVNITKKDMFEAIKKVKIEDDEDGLHYIQ